MKPFFSILLFLFAFSAASVAQPPKPLHAKGTAIGWKEFFPDFPGVRMGMSFKAAKGAIEKTGVKTVSLKGNTSEMVWNTKFAGIEGRATMLFKPRTGAWEIAVVVYAMEQQKDLVTAWREKIEKRNGPATEVHDDEYATSHVWRFRDGIALEIRAPKDPNSPIVDIHWVKE